jgi:F420-0:gamma-glutamyl ligase-like protein
MKFEFLDTLSKNTQISWKSVQWGRVVIEVLTGRQTDMTKLTDAFSDFVKAHKPRVKKYVSIRHQVDIFEKLM